MVAVAQMLIGTGMAETQDYNYLRLDPALPAYLQLGMEQETFAQLEGAWAGAMQQLVGFLYQQSSQDSVLANNLTLLELPNLLALLDWLADLLAQGDSSAEMVSDIAGRIEQLLANLNRPSALGKAVKLREESAGRIPEWGHIRFQNERLLIDRLLAAGQLQPAYEKAGALLEKAKTADYQGADYDLAMATNLLGQVLDTAGQAAPALDLFVEAQQLFETLGERGANMASVLLGRQATALWKLGRLDEAAKTYEKQISRSEKQADFRSVAVGKGQLATVRMLQKKYVEAVAGHKEALAIFEAQGEPKMVATAWHMIGMVHQKAGDYESAEAAYRRSLEILSQNNDRAGQATTLTQLGNLYDVSKRLEEAIVFHRKAADIDVELGNVRDEGIDRNNIANLLIRIKRNDEARAEIMRAIECNRLFGHAAEPWKSFNILRQIEEATGDPAAARAAWVQARDAYLAYRRQGGYAAQGQGGNLVEHVIGLIAQKKVDEIEPLFNELMNDPSSSDSRKVIIQAMIKILNGSRDRALGDDPTLNYADAAEVLFLIERLG
jgi:tetratricopeptide (TPR) repeat protein